MPFRRTSSSAHSRKRESRCDRSWKAPAAAVRTLHQTRSSPRSLSTSTVANKFAGFFDPSVRTRRRTRPARAPLLTPSAQIAAAISTRLEPEHEQHGLVALLLELGNELMLAARDRAQARQDRDVLLAVDLERHRRRVEAGA